MDLRIYQISQIIIFVLTLGLHSLLLFGLRHAFQRMHIKAERRQALIRYISLGVFFWLAILSFLALVGFFYQFDRFPPPLFLALIPPLILIFALLFSRFFRIVLKTIPERWLIYVQSFRILMELFLWAGYLGGFVPLQMTFEWLNFDIIVGLTAPMAGFVFFGRGRYRKFEAIIWNIFGVALLLNILLIAIFSLPTPYQAFSGEPDNSFVAIFPFVWIPGFIVPFALAMHIFSLQKLFSSRRRTRNFLIRR